MRYEQLIEGLIKVPNSILETVLVEVNGLIYGRITDFLTKESKKHTEEEMDIFHEDVIEFVRNNKHLYTTSYDFEETEYELGIELTPEQLHIDGYPKPNIQGKSILLVDISFNNKSFGGSIQFAKDFSLVKLNIKLREHFVKLSGRDANGEIVYSTNIYSIKNDLKDIPALIKHELMHFVQYIYFNPNIKKDSGRFAVNYYKKDEKGDYDLNNVDHDKYFTSNVEFNPYLQSEIEDFRQRYYVKDNLPLTYFNIQEYIGIPPKDKKPIGYKPVMASEYFKTLRAKAPTKFKKAAKIFFDYIVHNKDYTATNIN